MPTTDDRRARRMQAAIEIASATLREIDEKYGTANAAGTGELWRPYHNGTHARDVALGGVTLSQPLIANGDMDPEDEALGLIAGAEHDIEQELGSGPNETASAESAVRKMQAYPGVFSQRDQERVHAAVMSTVVATVDDQMHIVQSGRPDQPLDHVLEDADLASIGLPTGPHRGLLQHYEWEQRDGHIVLPRHERDFAGLHIDKERAMGYLEKQCTLYENHRFHLDETNQLLRHQQERNAAFLREQTERLRQVDKVDVGPEFAAIIEECKRFAMGHPMTLDLRAPTIYTFLGTGDALQPARPANLGQGAALLGSTTSARRVRRLPSGSSTPAGTSPDGGATERQAPGATDASSLPTTRSSSTKRLGAPTQRPDGQGRGPSSLAF